MGRGNNTGAAVLVSRQVAPKPPAADKLFSGLPYAQVEFKDGGLVAMAAAYGELLTQGRADLRDLTAIVDEQCARLAKARRRLAEIRAKARRQALDALRQRALNDGIYERPRQVASASEAFVLTAPRSPLAPRIRAQLARLDEFLNLDGLMVTPLGLTGNSREVGGYKLSFDEPWQLVLSRSDEYELEATLVHEVAHAIDHQLFTWNGVLGSGPVRIRPSDPVVTHPRLEPLFAAIEESPALERLDKSILESAFNPRSSLSRSGLMDGSHKRYYRSRRELFARAFTQWFALCSGDRDMLAALERHADYDDATACVVKQWRRDEFEPIARELDRLFADRLH